MRRIAIGGCLFIVATLALGQTGCSLGTAFGLSTPSYKLLPEAEEFRNLASPPPALPRELAKTPLAEYILEPGDALLIQPVDFDSPVRIPADQPILPDGVIELGIYGRPVVAGMTVPAVEAQVNQLVKAKEGKEYPITVRLVGRQSKVYYVLGEVNSPGSYPLSGRETVLDGIMAAGNLSRAAQEKKIILVRPTQPDGCREVLPVCYPQIIQLGDTSTNYQLRPGDRIYVPSKSTMESLFPSLSKTTAPCCKPHVPCYTGGGGMMCDPTTIPIGVSASPTTFTPAPATMPSTLPASMTGR